MTNMTINGHKWTIKNLDGEHKRYVFSDDVELRDVYGRYSDAKRKAYKRCRELFESVGGECFNIVSANTFQFTVGFEFEDRETGDRYFAYITRCYDYAMKLD